MLKNTFLFVWLLTATLIMTYILGNYHYYLGFSYPKSFVIWASDLYGASNAEEMADLGIILNFTVSFLTVFIATFIFLIVKKKLTKSSSGR
ncbi:MAG: hypothetical protein GY820_19610 [Gammaproteobacteria bacterium]|nr:hypothetical protein [Gammaproteobacteria bacterium]